MEHTLWCRLVACSVALFITVLSPVRAEDDAGQIIEATGFTGGFIVHLGCGDGTLTAALRVNDGCLVHGLGRDMQNVEHAREFIRSQQLYGPVSVDHLVGERLPYIDNLVNLLVVENLGDVPMDEVMRVLVPNGVAYVRSGEGWTKTVKPRPEEIDEWTHFLHDPSGNAVAHDDVVGPPRHLQWVGNPRWSRHHDRMSSMSALVTTGGRLFYIMDEGSRVSIQTPSHWKLIARDAFNGTILWKRDIGDWQSHLWPLKSGPTQLARRLVAVNDRVYVTLGFESPLHVVDAATGETVLTLEDSQLTEEVLVVGDVVYVLVNKGEGELSDYVAANNVGDQARVRREYRWNEQPRRIHAYDCDTGELLWGRESRVSPLTMAADDERLYFHDGEKVVALDRTTGEKIWAGEPAGRRRLVTMNFGPRLLVHEDVVIFAGGNRKMTAYAASTGEVLWKADHDKSGYESPEDLLVVGGLVWSWPTTSGRDSGELTGRDPHTGEVKSQFAPNVDTYWFHHRCYIAKATDKYLLPSRTGVEFVDFAKQDWEIHHWVRGGCLYGVMPANGLLYAPPHNCACYPEAKLYGFNALATASPSRTAAGIDSPDRLEKGPAYLAFAQEPDAQTLDLKSQISNLKSTDSWPMFRHDSRRSGKTDVVLEAALDQDWDVQLGGRLSGVVIAEGRLLVAQIDQHTVHCLDADTGDRQWSYTAGGRVDSPPTLHSGRAYFGSADGWVYCLRLNDGELVWRFRAAPHDRRLMAFEQLESVWPVHGSVLVQDDAVSFVAGRSNFLDGGLRMIKLNADTGELSMEKVIDDKDPETGENLQIRIKTLQMPVGLPDILSSDGSYVYMRSQRFDLDGNRLEIGPHSGKAEEQGAAQHGDGTHLFAPMGFLDGTYFHRAYWVFGRSYAGGHNGYFQAGKFAPSGRLLVFDDDTVYGFGRKPQYYRWTTTIEHQLFSTSKEPPEPPSSRSTRRGRGESFIRFGKPKELDPTGQPIVVEAWIKAERDGVVLARGGPVRGYALYVKNGRPHFTVREASEATTVAGSQAVRGRWAHLVGRLTNDLELKLSVDGETVATGMVPSQITVDPAQGLEIGGDEGGAAGAYGSPFEFTGIIDEVRVYHADLTDADVKDRFADTPLADTLAERLVLSCGFDDGKPTDSSGRGHHGRSSRARAVDGKHGKGLRFSGRANRAGGSNVVMNWTQDVPLYAMAMVMAGDRLFLCGPKDVIDEEQTFKQIVAKDESVQQQLQEQEAALAGQRGGVLMSVSARDGEDSTTMEIDALPVWDGMAVAFGRLFIATTDGRVLCFREQGR